MRSWWQQIYKVTEQPQNVAEAPSSPPKSVLPPFNATQYFPASFAIEWSSEWFLPIECGKWYDFSHLRRQTSDILLLLSCPLTPGPGGHRVSIMQMTIMWQGMGAKQLWRNLALRRPTNPPTWIMPIRIYINEKKNLYLNHCIFRSLLQQHSIVWLVDYINPYILNPYIPNT